MNKPKQLLTNLKQHALNDAEGFKHALYSYKLTKFIEEEIYAYDPQALKQNWRLGKLHEEWNDLLRHKLLRVLAPRDHLKTFFFTVAYICFLLKYEPNATIYLYSKTDGQAVKILDQIKRIIKRNPYLDMLSDGDMVDFWSKKELRTSIGSTVYAQGWGTAQRGAHPKYIILDDIIDSQVVYSDEQNQKVIERFAGDVLPMAEPDTQIIFVGTLQRENDIYSVLDPDQYTLKTYSAIVDEEKQLTLYPEKWNWAQLMARRREITEMYGDNFFLKEYCNMPVQLMGEIVKKEWLKFYRQPDLPAGTDYMGFDLSVGKDPTKGDYTACVVFRMTTTGDIYIRHVYRDRIDFAKRLKKIIELYNDYKPQWVQIEDNAFQNDTVQTLKHQTNLPIRGIKTTKNKEQKFAEDLAPLFENGKVHILEGAEWSQMFCSELLALPRGAHDDMADALLIGKSGLGTFAEPRIRLL